MAFDGAEAYAFTPEGVREGAPPGERGSIRDALIAELRPTCNSL